MNLQEFKKQFFAESGSFRAMNGKIIFADRQVVAAIRQIIATSENRKTSVSSYINNVLRQHLTSNKEVIREIILEAQTNATMDFEQL